MMIRASRHVPILLLTLLIAGCATHTKLDGVWQDPAYVGQPAQKIMIVAIARTERNELIWESAFSHQLQARGARPMAGSTGIPKEARADADAFKAAVRASGADLVAVTRLLAIDKDQKYIPGATGYVPVVTYAGYYGFYTTAYAVVQSPGYIKESTIVKLETNIYDVKTEKMVWSAVSHTIDPETTQDAAESIVRAIADDLASNGVIKKK